MMPAAPPPEIPPPGTPRRTEPDTPAPDTPYRPAPPAPPVVTWPASDDAAEDLAARLRRDRRLLLRGRLDEEACTRVSAELMLLDGTSADPVELLISSEGGAAEDVVGLLDVIGLMRAPLTTRCIGAAIGTAAVVLASGTRRRLAGPTARLGLRLSDDYDARGTAADLALLAESALTVRARLAEHIAGVTALTPTEALEQFARGELLAPEDAVDRGLIDRIAAR